MRAICDPMVAAFRETRHDIGDRMVAVTLSVGFATHGAERAFASADRLLEAAGQTIHSAKLEGPNRAIEYEQRAQPNGAVRAAATRFVP